MSPRLPQELIDLVIDYHSLDLATLRRISLVSSACSYTAFHHIFFDVAVSARPFGPRNLRDFLSLLRTGALVWRSVRHLKIGASSERGEMDLTPAMVLEILQRLPRLCSVEFTNLNIGASSSLPLSLTQCSASTLDRLSFLSCRIRGDTWKPLLDIIHLFKSVSSLTLSKVYHDHFIDHESGCCLSRAPTLKTGVKSLDFVDDTENTSTLVEGLTRVLDLSEVGQLQVGYGPSVRMRTAYRQLICAMSLNLRKLCMDVTGTCLLQLPRPLGVLMNGRRRR